MSNDKDVKKPETDDPNPGTATPADTGTEAQSDQQDPEPVPDRPVQFMNWRLIGWIVLLVVVVGLLLAGLPE